MAYFGKDEVAKARAKDDAEEEPDIVCHGNQHEKVGHSHLDDVQERLDDVHRHADGVVL